MTTASTVSGCGQIVREFAIEEKCDEATRAAELQQPENVNVAFCYNNSAVFIYFRDMRGMPNAHTKSMYKKYNILLAEATYIAQPSFS